MYLQLEIRGKDCQLDDLTSVDVITVCKVIQKIIIRMDFRYLSDVNKRAKKVCLEPKIHFS